MTNFEIKDFLSLFPDSLMNLSVEEQEASILLYQLLAKGSPVTVRVDSSIPYLFKSGSFSCPFAKNPVRNTIVGEIRILFISPI